MCVGQSGFIVWIFQLTRPRLHYLTTGQTTRTMIVAAVCCRIVVLYLQENCRCYCRLFLSRGKSVVTWNQTQNYSSLPRLWFFKWAYCVWDNLWCAGKRKRIIKYAKYVERIACMTINYILLIWSQLVEHRGTWSWLPAAVTRRHTDKLQRLFLFVFIGQNVRTSTST